MEDILLSFVSLQVLYACGGRLNGRLVSLPGLTLAGEVQNFCGVFRFYGSCQMLMRSPN